jgi:radical SAM protein with 4Fe4S-binding SPASM domain
MFNEYLKRVKYLISFLKKDLVHLNMQILYQCNFKCKICDFWKEPYKNMPMLKVEDARVIAEKLKKMGPQIISIGGGEPLLHKDLLEIITLFSKNNFPVMITNGWFIDAAMARKLWQTGMYEISVSLDYASAEKHDEMRNKKGAFERATNALKVLSENRVYPYQRVHTISTVMHENIDEIESLIELSKELGVTYLVSSYSPNRGVVGTPPQRIEFAKKLLALKKKYKEFVSIRGYLAQFSEALNNPEGIPNCSAGKNLFNIDCQGDVTLCIDRLEDKVGNILIDKPKELKKRLNEKYKNNTCSKCWTSCRGPIESQMYGKNKLINMWDNYQLIKNIPVNK